MQLKVKIKYVFFSSKTPLRNSGLLVLALTFALFSVAPWLVVKLCCRLNLCMDLSLGKKKKKHQRNLFPIRWLFAVLTKAPSCTCILGKLSPEKGYRIILNLPVCLMW